MSILDKSVSKAKDENWDFQCPGIQGSGCGVPGGQPFASTGWPTKKVALERGRQHFAEHKTGEPMQSLEEFRADQGLVVNDDGSVSLEDI